MMMRSSLLSSSPNPKRSVRDSDADENKDQHHDDNAGGADDDDDDDYWSRRKTTLEEEKAEAPHNNSNNGDSSYYPQQQPYSGYNNNGNYCYYSSDNATDSNPEMMDIYVGGSGGGGGRVTRPRRRKRRHDNNDEALTETDDDEEKVRGNVMNVNSPPRQQQPYSQQHVQYRHHRQQQQQQQPSYLSHIPEHSQTMSKLSRIRRFGCSKKMQSILLAISVTYLFLILHIYHQVAYNNNNNYISGSSTTSTLLSSFQQHQPQQKLDQQQQQHAHAPLLLLQPKDNYNFNDASERQRRLLARTFLEERKTKQRRLATKAQQERSKQRQRQTRPPMPVLKKKKKNTNGDVMTTIPRYSIWKADQGILQYSNIEQQQQQVEYGPPATMQDLCGFFAQNASLSQGQQGNDSDNNSDTSFYYWRRHALGPSSRVLLAGHLLESSVAMHLVAVLRQECNVTHIVGMDMSSSSSTSASGATSILNPLGFLAKLWKEQPLQTGSLGLDPKHSSSSSSLSRLPISGQVDLVQAFAPTHIVYFPPALLQSSSLSSSLSQSSKKKNSNKRQLLLYRSWIAMEQILASLAANTDNANTATGKTRPQFCFLAHHASLEVLANTYAALADVASLALRIPANVFGPWEQQEQSSSSSSVHSLLQGAVWNQTLSSSSSLDLVYAKDAVEGLLAAMQVRPPMTSAAALELHASAQVSTEELQYKIKDLLFSSSSSGQTLGQDQDAQRHNNDLAPPSLALSTSPAVHLAKRFLQWYPSTSLEHGLIQTLAWHLDQAHPFVTTTTATSSTTTTGSNDASTSTTNAVDVAAPAGASLLPTIFSTGDALLQNHSLPTCAADDVVCHSVPRYSYMPCLSECNTKQQCLSSIFDAIVPLIHEVLEGCGVVLYTQAMGSSVTDLETEYLEEDEGDDSFLVCAIAFVSVDSALVQNAMERVPDADFARMGVLPQHDFHGTEAISKLKREKLNGRLLYRGWVLLWPDAQEQDNVPEPIPHADEYLLKLAPGRLFPKETKYAVFIDQHFSVAPKADDILFLVDELYRSAVPERTILHKTVPLMSTVPAAHVRLPAEPNKRAVVLLSQLRRQESSSPSSLSEQQQNLLQGKKLSVKQASRFMRFENGEDPLLKREPTAIKEQREFYERSISIVNKKLEQSSSSSSSSSTEPGYSFEMKHWARTRWVVHDMQVEQGRQLRCEWYQEHLQWGNNLDQLSFAFVMAKRELERRMEFGEIDDRARAALKEKTEMKRVLMDVFEWHSLKTPQNKDYSPYEEIEILGYDASIPENPQPIEPDPSASATAPLFVRIISDRVMSLARRAWNNRKG